MDQQTRVEVVRDSALAATFPANDPIALNDGDPGAAMRMSRAWALARHRGESEFPAPTAA